MVRRRLKAFSVLSLLSRKVATFMLLPTMPRSALFSLLSATAVAVFHPSSGSVTSGIPPLRFAPGKVARFFSVRIGCPCFRLELRTQMGR